jgi:hypothetical protein
MNSLTTCSRCAGFLSSTAAVCPHCDARPARSRRRRVGVLLGLAGSASLGLTMMACYGCPPSECREYVPDGGGDATGDATGVDGGAQD